MSRDKGTIRGKNSKPSVIVDIYVWIYRDKEKRFLTSADHRPHWNRSTRRVPSRRVEYFFHESRNDIYIYISSSRFIFPFVFPLGIRARYPPRFHRFNSMWYRYASRIDRSWKTSSKQRRGRNRPRWVPALLAIIRNNTRDGLKTGELEFQWCLERYAISNARQRITNYVSNLHLEYR